MEIPSIHNALLYKDITHRRDGKGNIDSHKDCRIGNVVKFALQSFTQRSVQFDTPL